MDKSTAKGNGEAGKVLNAISMKVNILMIRSTVMASFNGQVEIVIKENTKMMNVMVMEK